MPTQNRLTLIKTICCSLLLLFWLFIPFTANSQQVITTYAGNGAVGYSGDGIPATSSELASPSSLTMDAAGNIYIADYANNRIRKVDAITKIITTIAGNGSPTFSGDGGLAVNAGINGPIDISCDVNGNIYFADFQSFRVRKINAATGIINTVAGNGTQNYVQGSLATNTGIASASGVTVDKNGNLYIPGYSSHVILRVDAVTGIITTFAGNGTQAYTGDGGPAINAGLSPLGLRTDNAGNLFFADNLDNAIRKIDAVTGIITTVVGTGIAGYAGENGLATAARLNGPEDVHVDAAGDLIIADAGNNIIRKVNATTGIITLVAGNTLRGYSGDGGVATCARLSSPSEVITDPIGNIFICDNGNNVIRRIDHSVITIKNPVMQISASNYSVCLGDSISLASTLQNGGLNPLYQWFRNSQFIGPNAPGFTTITVSPSDTFSCVFAFSNDDCLRGSYLSNTIIVKSAPLTQASVSLASSKTEICSGDNITFNAAPINGGPNPVFEWQVGRQIITVNGPANFTIPLTGTSKVKVIMFPDQSTCARPVQVADSLNILVHPTDTAAIAIGTEDSTICLGALTIFTAYYSQAGVTSQFQWMVNGNPAGTNSPRFIPTNLSNGSIVSCLLIVDTTAGCVRPSHVLSNFIPITVDPTPAPVVGIQASGNDVCQGTPITFTASLISGGTDPVYQWQVNGNNTGVTGPTYTNNNLTDGDQVNVVLTGGHLLCVAGTGVSSAILTMAIKPAPLVTVNPADTSVYAGHSVPINVTVIGSVSTVSWQPSSGLNDPTSLTPIANPASSTTYIVKVMGDNGCETDKTSNIKIYRVMNMPNAFTPGKTINNIFRIPPGVGLTLKEFSVFNRWGQRIFTTSDISRGWDGTLHGAICDPGTYVFFVTGTSQGKEVIFKGTVTLIR